MINADGQALRICTECNPHHYENCRSCFGFGVYPGKEIDIVPISAGDAIDGKWPSLWRPCPECKSTPKGLPDA